MSKMQEEKLPFGIFWAAISARISSSPEASNARTSRQNGDQKNVSMSSRNRSSRTRSKLLVSRFSNSWRSPEMSDQTIGIGEVREPLAASGQHPLEDSLRLAQTARSGRNVDEFEGRQLGKQRQVMLQMRGERGVRFKPRIDVAEGQLVGARTGKDGQAIQ